MDNSPNIGITMGDPAGIGPEIVLKSLTSLQHINLCAGLTSQFVIIGSENIINETAERFSLPIPCPVIDCIKIKREEVPYGKVSYKSGKVAYESILKAVELAQEGEIDTIVTGPINKSVVNLVHPDFTGHTELLASLTGTKKFAMMLASDKLKVTLVTTHLPIKEVSEVLTKESILDKIKLTYEFLKKTQRLKDSKTQKLKIGVCALNPHGGEAGLFGDEEEQKIVPAIEEAQSEGIEVEGPYPSDTIFNKDFDAYIAMYHDQGMIPIKLTSFGRAVNITLGLPFIRTSPDHGTAYDIAGKGVANPGSMIEAIKMAKRLVNN